jgi:glutaredoxin-related protein
MESCPDCTQVKQLYKDDPAYELIDIGQNARNLKEFLALRDNHPAFAKVRERGNIGIPCFVKEDSTVIISLKHYDAAQAADRQPQTYAEGAACNLDGTGC